MKKRKSSEVKVGIFVTVVIALLMFVIVTLSSRSSIFRSTRELHTSFENVMGLSEGSEVRLSGVDIGLVKRVKFSDEAGKTAVYVDMSIFNEALNRIPKDSVATIETLGLLGKKYIEIVPGDPKSGFVAEHDTIEGKTPEPLTKFLDDIGEKFSKVEDIMGNLDVITASIKGGDGAPVTDLSKAISGLQHMIEEVKSGKGILHVLIYDSEKSKIVSDLAATVATIKEVVNDVKHGEGTLHAIIYSDKGERMISNLADTSEDIKGMVATVKTEPGVLHSLIYDPEKAKIVEDIKETSSNLRVVSEKVVRGEGTLGALIVDPTIYEDMKKITGGLERSRIFKSVVRSVIQRYESDEEQTPD